MTQMLLGELGYDTAIICSSVSADFTTSLSLITQAVEFKRYGGLARNLRYHSRM